MSAQIGIPGSPITGKTLRDQFAMAALARLLPFQPPKKMPEWMEPLTVGEIVARLAYYQADCMLKEREQPPLENAP